MTSPGSRRRCAKITSSISADCGHCRARLKFHRSLDVTLAVLTSLAVLFFLFALAVLQHIKPLEHVAFNVLGLDISDMYHMLCRPESPDWCSRSRAGTGADGYARAHLSE